MDGVPILRAFGHLHSDLALTVAVFAAQQARRLDLATQRGRRHGDGNPAKQIKPVTLEEFMRLHGDEDVEVAARAAARARIPLAGQPDPRAVVHPRGDADLKNPFAANLAVAGAGPARIENEASGAPAARTGGFNLKESLAAPHPSGAAARPAERGVGSGPRARTLAGLTRHGGWNLDLHLCARIGLLERALEVIAQVLAPPRWAAGPDRTCRQRRRRTHR